MDLRTCRQLTDIHSCLYPEKPQNITDTGVTPLRSRGYPVCNWIGENFVTNSGGFNG